MITEEIKVTWIEERDVPEPQTYNSNPTSKDIKDYVDACKKSRIRQQGVIVDFIKSLFGTVYAIVNTGDNKIVKVDINKLTVIHKPKKNGKK